MPPRKRKSTLGRGTADAKRKKALRAAETGEERERRLGNLRSRASTSRAAETEEEREQRLEDLRSRASTSRAAETEEERELRLVNLRSHTSTSRAAETEEERELRLVNLRSHTSTSRAAETEEEREQRLEDLRSRASTSRAAEAEDEREQRLEDLRSRASTSRAAETAKQTEERREADRVQTSTLRAAETAEQTEERREADRVQTSTSRAAETEEMRRQRVEVQRVRQSRVRNLKWTGIEDGAFNYDPQIDYESDNFLSLDSMSDVCNFCLAKKWKDESAGMCCASGKVRLPELRPPPEPLLTYLNGEPSDAKQFLKNLRSYNSVFQMTSFGGNVCMENGWMPTFKIQGQIYHRIGSLLPARGISPKFMQLYFIGDTDAEVEARCNVLPHGQSRVNSGIVTGLRHMLHTHNPYVRDLKAVAQWTSENDEVPDFRVVIHADRKPAGEHAGQYNAPTTNEIAVVLVEHNIGERRDILISTRDGRLHRIAETHRSYDCLQYPLMFVYGEDGYNMTDVQVDPKTGALTNKKISAMDFYAYRMMVRGPPHHPNYLLFFRALGNQFWVDMYAKIETERLNYLRYNQGKLRAEDYAHLRDAVAQDGHVEDMGQLVILPSSFTGGPRYMHERIQDLLTYVRYYGRPDLFITLTCNSQWKELKDALYPGQSAQDRYDIVSRVFYLKVKKFMKLMTKKKIFGAVRCFSYSVEWQKRGLPHLHVLFWLVERLNAERVDQCISAEIPDPREDPKLYQLVTRHMIHGPCGQWNPQCVCMKDGLCSKKFPKKFVSETITGEDGYPKYRRRSPEEGGQSFNLKMRGGREVDVDNRWVVPYSPLLLRLFNSHVNVESCHSVKAIHYICKYVNKGSDWATVQMKQNSVDGNVANANVQNHDEILSFQTGRYISSSEATWRILGFPIHEHSPTVTKLDVHLENGQRVYYTPENVTSVLERSPRSTLLAFFELCRKDAFARTLLYHQIPEHYTLTSAKKWNRRRTGFALGRVYTVHPNNVECYFLRLLLHTVPGPTSFEYLRTVNGEICETYRIACMRLGLLEDDQCWKHTLDEAAVSQTPHRLRYLFAVMLTVCQVTDPKTLWEEHKEHFAHDVLRQSRIRINNSQLDYNDEIFNKALLLLQNTLGTLTSKTLSDFGLPQPVPEEGVPQPAAEGYNVQELRTYVDENEPKLTVEQRAVYDEIMESVDQRRGKIFFLDAPGGTGKTFLTNLILSNVRSSNRIVFAVASCGIAATLLQDGKTAHATFKLPLNLHHQEQPVCSIKRGSNMAKLLRECVLIVWDECTMSNKKAIEAVDRTLRDLTGKNVVMGGITFLFSGDFRQTLPVIAKGTRADEVQASLKASYIWRSIKSLRLHTNMRVHLQGNAEAGHFADLLLQIGEGRRPHTNRTNEIAIPEDLGKVVGTIECLVSEVYPHLRDLQHKSSDWFCDRSILSPRNDQVAAINNRLLDNCSGDKVMYKSVDVTLDIDDAVNFPTEFLNSLDLPGLPPHELHLKTHAPVILLRNLDAPRLCNGTRLRIVQLKANVLEAEILTGCAKGDIVFIPRIPMIPSDTPYQFKRLQFPVKLCFAMTINKAQGQTFRVAGIDLRTPCFSHGQLYVACSRVTGSAGLVILADKGRTANVVYPEVLCKL